MPSRDNRPIDVHARMASRGSGWYQSMRADSLARLGALSDLNIAAQGTVPLKTYMAEMGQSKLCFSPFGYGELCWRDIEAIRVGAVLIKPDMGHLETGPELYESGVTYLPVRWDFADLEEVIRGALADEARCRQIASAAWTRVSTVICAKHALSRTWASSSATEDKMPSERRHEAWQRLEHCLQGVL